MLTFDPEMGESVRRAFTQGKAFDGIHYGVYASQFGPNASVWMIDGSSVRVAGDPELHFRSRERYPIMGAENRCSAIEETIRRNALLGELSGTIVEPLNCPPGRYFPRIARPNRQNPNGFPAPFLPLEFAHEEAAAVLQLTSLATRLSAAFQNVHPDPRNFSTFGTEFRNIIILASTEFEAQCKGILRENNYHPRPSKDLKTKDYVKLRDVLRLDDYSIALIQFPWLEPIAPLANWNADYATQSIPWYAANNALKHDREMNFEQATLENAAYAVSAALIVCIAQFGIGFLQGNRVLSEIFAVKTYPFWSIGDTYGYDPYGQVHTPRIDYPFS